MASAVIQINGIPGSQDNLPLGVSVSLTNADNSNLSSLQWKVLDSPKDLLGNASVQAPIGTVVNQTLSGGFSAYTFTPDVTGEYLLQLTTTDLLGTTRTDEQVMNIREVYNQDFIPAAGRKGTGLLFSRGWAETLNRSLKTFNRQNGIGARISVVYNGAGSLARGSCVKITGVVDGRNVSPNVTPPGVLPAEYMFQVDVATAADAGIASRSVFVLDTALNTSSRFGRAVSVGLLDNYNITANLAGAVLGQLVYLSNAGGLTLTPGTTTVVVAEVVQTGTAGALFVNGLGLAAAASSPVSITVGPGLSSTQTPITGTATLSVTEPLPTHTAVGKLVYDTGSAYAETAAGTATQVLHGGGAGAPTWSGVSLSADVTGTLPIGSGGSGATNAAAARSNFGLVIGSDVLSAGSDSVGATQLSRLSLRIYFANGRDLSGDFTLTGVKAGDEIMSVVNLGAGPGMGSRVTGEFTTLAPADDTLHQTSASLFAAAGLLFFIVAKGG